MKIPSYVIVATGTCSLSSWQSSVIMSCNELQFWHTVIQVVTKCHFACNMWWLLLSCLLKHRHGLFSAKKPSIFVWCWYIVSSPTLMTLNLFIALWIPSYLVFKVAGIQSSNLIFNLFGATKPNYVWSCFKRVIEENLKYLSY